MFLNIKDIQETLRFKVHPYLNVYGHNISVYSLCAGTGLCISILLLTSLLHRKLLLSKYISLILRSLVGLAIGGRLFGVLSKGLGNLYSYGEFQLYDSIFHSGVVYIGGVLGFVGMAYIQCILLNKNFLDFSDEFGVCIPLFHGFGRLGCFWGGCCYGIEYTGILSIPYPSNVGQAVVYRFPIQLLEAFFEILLFFCILILYKNGKYTKKLLSIYIVTYCLFRICFECLRGDEVRGVFGYISFSQIICSIIIIINIKLFVNN